jgi:MarR family transcriptional regulator, organic hydroperoxide resistance regulator
VPHGHILAMHLRRAYLTMHRRFQNHFDGFGVTADQFVLLTLLAEAEGVAQKDLVARSFSDPNTLRAMLVLLENKGLVLRRRHETDGRARLVFLTPKGRKLQQDLWRSAVPLHQLLLESLPANEVEQVQKQLAKVAEVMTLPKTRSRPAAGRKG